MARANVNADAIDALLPQTQCGLCSYNGCRPYAEAIATKNEAINRCPPGGVATLQKLADLLEINAEPMLEDMARKAKPPLLARIIEADCIGCTKCIQACPVDAILGAAKQMHTVITTECTGCELCLPVCPVDCIEMFPAESSSEAVQKAKADLSRERFQFHQQRLAQLEQRKKASTHSANLQSTETTLQAMQQTDIKAARRAAVLAAVQRVKTKKRSAS